MLLLLALRVIAVRYKAIFDMLVAYFSIGDCFVPRNDAGESLITQEEFL
jgi:hypothetical protein